MMGAELCSQKQLTSTNAHLKMISIHFAKCVSGLFFFSMWSSFFSARSHIKFRSRNADNDDDGMFFFIFLRTKILRHFAQWCILTRPSPMTIVKQVFYENLVKECFSFIFLRTKILRQFAQWCILTRPNPMNIVKWVFYENLMKECFFYFPEDKDFTPFCTMVHFDEAQSSDSTGCPLLTLFFETLEKQPCKQRSDFVLNRQLRTPK